jgi:hypothetical protein
MGSAGEGRRPRLGSIRGRARAAIPFGVLAALATAVAALPSTAAAPTSSPCTSDSLPPPLESYPDGSTTGVPEGTPLTRIDGDYRTQGYGQVIDRLDITGRLFVDHDNVKVKCTRVWRMTTNDGAGLQMWLSTLGDPRGVPEGSALKSSDYTLRRVEIVGTIDGLKAEGNVDVRDSYIHDLYRTDDATQDSGTTHNDGVQIGRGADMVFKHNTLHMWSFADGERAGTHLFKAPYGDGEGYMTSAFLINEAQGPITRVLIEDNLIRGRTSKYIHAISGTRVRIINNKIGRENRDYPNVFAVRKEDIVVRGNVHVDGTPIAP